MISASYEYGRHVCGPTPRFDLKNSSLKCSSVNHDSIPDDGLFWGSVPGCHGPTPKCHKIWKRFRQKKRKERSSGNELI